MTATDADRERVGRGAFANGTLEPTDQHGMGTETTDSSGRLLPADSDETPVLSIVMPTLNEEEGIATCIRQVRRALDNLGVNGEIIVSDSSSDRTPEIAREMGAIVVVPDRRGYGYAYRYGFEHARGEYIAMGDADTTYDFEELPKLFRLVEEGADIAMGSRLEGEITPGAMPKLHQYVGNPLLTWFLNVFYGAGVSDAHSGMRVFHRGVLDELSLETEGMEFASEMIMQASTAGLEIAEVPITYHERTGEATLDSFHDGWRHVRFMLLNAPGYLFSGPGVLFGALGVVVMLLAYTNTVLFGFKFGIRSMTAGSLLTIVGFQVASMGVFATIAGDPIKRVENAWGEWVTHNLSLEHGASIGLVLFAAGVVYATLSIYQWVQSGFSDLPFLMSDVLAFTAIILGLQVVFHSFFLSVIGDQTKG